MEGSRAIARHARTRRARAWLAVLTVLVLLVPLTPASAAPSGQAKVFVYWTPLASECANLNRVAKRVAKPRVATRALTKLLAGPTKADRDRGVTSYLFSSRTKGMLRSVNIRDGVAHVDLRDLRPVLPKAKTSCGRTSLLSQLNATTMQFPTVHSARYSINGNERTFYRWLGLRVPGRSKVLAIRGTLRNTRLLRNTNGRRARLWRIRVGRHPGFDRLVFQFDRGRPPYAIRYLPVPRSDGSGAPIPFDGTVGLQVEMGAQTFIPDVQGFPLTFRPTHLVPRYQTLRSVRYGGWFEGWADFGVGLKARSGFRVLEMANPPRLVIDVAHGAKVRALRRGTRGVDVRDWQRQLNTVQFGPFAVSTAPGQGRLRPNGVVDQRTVRATRVFQRAEGVPVDGVVRWRTRRALRRAIWRARASIRP
jgi:hypothetical protein